jgi:hypothetical protein
MGSPDDNEKPRGRSTGRTGESAFELTPVKSRTKSAPTGDAAKRAPADPWSDFEPTNTGAKLTKASQLELTPVAPARALTQATRPSLAPVPSKRPGGLQKHLQSSGFDDEERTQLDVVLGRTRPVELDLDEEAPTGVHEVFDGVTAAESVMATETWLAVNAPVQSRLGRRSPRAYWSVIDQFAAGHNPRYTPEAPAKPRAHLLIWDISRAMGCEVPHLLGGKELSLAETVDWVRREGPERGWRRLDAGRAVAAADRGEMVLAMPRDPRQRLVAVVRPGGLGDDGFPRVASANPQRGADLSATEVLGRLIDYYGHP